MTDERSTRADSTERAHHVGDGEPAAPRQRRMSAQRKQEAVLRVLRGEDLELVSRDLGVTAAALIETILRERKHPVQGFRTCLGILRLGKTHGNQALEDAADYALAIGGTSSGNCSDLSVLR